MEGLNPSSNPHYEDYSGSDYSDDGAAKDSGKDMVPLSIDTSSSHLMKPLSIQTKFDTSPAPSASSTDTSSEVGSAFNSPVQGSFGGGQGSPKSGGRPPEEASIFDDVRDIKKFLVIRMTSGGCDMKVSFFYYGWLAKFLARFVSGIFYKLN